MIGISSEQVRGFTLGGLFVLVVGVVLFIKAWLSKSHDLEAENQTLVQERKLDDLRAKNKTETSHLSDADLRTELDEFIKGDGSGKPH